jgi:RHS repeat-associated protein
VGKPILSQNTRQHNYKKQAYSYELLDALGRTIETGQKTENNDAVIFNTIFGDTIMGFYNPNVISPIKFLTWINDTKGPRTEVTHTYYDVQDILPPAVLAQQELRNRVAASVYYDTLRMDSMIFSNAKFYSYDVHGNVNTLVQDDSVKGISGQRYKDISYQYDLVDDKVNEMDYQSGYLDQYHVKYGYDADFRLTQVSTSKDSILWDNDANYFYYAHGPLAREEMGDQQIQGVDYAYTIGGWAKAVNSDALEGEKDMGHDAFQQAGNLNSNFARDAFGYSINYFTGDYDPINKSLWNNPATRFEADVVHSDLMDSRHDLFNGNVTAMVTTITQPQKYTEANTTASGIILPQGAAYNHDQLNRLIDMKAYRNLDTVNNIWLTNGLRGGLYHNCLTYDANGNILTQKRADSLGNVFDSLTYRYNNNNGTGPTIQNRLYHVNDAIPGSIDGITDDIKDEGVFNTTETLINEKNNYRYNAMGELAKDSMAGIDTIIWTQYGKVWKVKKYSGDSIIFIYNGSDEYISKEFKPATGNPFITNYIRDSKGNIIAIYNQKTIGSTLSYQLAERDIYGSKRIGSENSIVELISPVPISEVDTFNRYLGLKKYELDNNIGNVLTVVSDRKIPRPNGTGDRIAYFEPDVLSAQDYFGFGMIEPEREYAFSKYRFGFGSKEKIDEIYGPAEAYDFGARIYDPRLGKFMSEDPRAMDYAPISPYTYTLDNPIIFRDNNGKKVIGSDGKEVTYTIGEGGKVLWSANATEDDKKIGEGMMKTEKGKEVFDNLVASKGKVHLVYSKDAFISPKDKNGKVHIALGYTGANTFNKDGSPKTVKEKNGKEVYEDATLTIYKGSFDISKGDFSKLPKDVKPGDIQIVYPGREYKATEEEFINGVGTHEGTHFLNDISVQNDANNRPTAKEANEYYNANIETKPNSEEDIGRAQYDKANNITKPSSNDKAAPANKPAQSGGGGQ